MFKSILIAVVVLQTSIPVLADEDFNVGLRKIEVVSEETHEIFPATVVYPTKSTAKSVRFGAFEMEVSVNAEIATGKFPLVIISHGSGGSDIGYRSIALSLVKYGFIVGMPLHPKNNYKNNSAQGTINNWVNRPKHVKATIDTLLLNPELSGSIDNNKIALVGHSAGGYTALVASGGVADTVHIDELCRDKLQLNHAFCKLGAESESPPVRIKDEIDERIKAAVLMAPVGILFESKDSLAQVEVPVLLLRAEKDEVLTEPYHSEIIANNFPNKSKLTYRTITNAGHYSFITPFPDYLKSGLGAVAEDPDGFDRARFHKTIGSEIANYLISVIH